MGSALAAVLVRTGPDGAFEIRELPIPEVGPDDGLLRVDRCGVCGSDYRRFRRERNEDEALGDRQDKRPLPAIMGHEIAGTIVALGREAARTWGVREGEQVFVESNVTCHRCRACMTGHYKACRESWSYGLSRGLDEPPHLWGGYAQYLYLHPRVLLHKLPKGVSAEDAVLATPISNGFQWAYRTPDLRYGQSIVILGPGQQGLGCVAAAKAVGAGLIIVSGLRRDERRLELARRLGADHVIVADEEPVVARVRELTGGEMADVAVEVSGGASAQRDVIDLVRRGGTVTWAAGGGFAPTELVMDRVTRRSITIRGVLSHGYDEIDQALGLIGARTLPVREMSTHTVTLREPERAVLLAGNEIPGESAIHVSIDPWVTAA